MTDATTPTTPEPAPERRRTTLTVRRENRETLRYLELARVTREQKLQLEREACAEAPEAEFFEKTWKKRRPENLLEIHALVDKLGAPEPTPAEETPAAAAEPTPIPVEIQTVPEPVLTPVHEPLSDGERAALARAMPGEVTNVTVIYRTARGLIVEVTFLREGQPDTTIVRLLGENVQDLETIRARVEELPVPESAPVAAEPEALPETLPAPTVELPPPEAAPVTETPFPATEAEPATPAPAPTPDAAPEPAKKSRFGFGKKEKKQDAPTAPAPEKADAPKEEKKSRFGFGKKEKTAEEPPAAPHAAAPAPEKKSRFGFGKKEKKGEAAAEPAAPAPAESAPEATPAEAPAEKKGGLKGLTGRFGKKKE